MPVGVTARPDHVAIAVADLERAAARWRDTLGGGLVNAWDNGVFAGRQYRYPNGGKVELLAPSPHDERRESFIARFLDRYGTRIHHLTLLVTDLRDTIATLEAAGLDVVDVDLTSERWREAFLRPSQVGGLVIQVAETDRTVEEWARERDVAIEDPAPGAALLLGPTLAHPELERAGRLWGLLGGEVGETAGGLLVTWQDTTLSVRVVHGEVAAPLALRMAGTPDLPHEDGVGPAIDGEDLPTDIGP